MEFHVIVYLVSMWIILLSSSGSVPSPTLNKRLENSLTSEASWTDKIWRRMLMVNFKTLTWRHKYERL